jgi:hypothetical protein
MKVFKFDISRSAKGELVADIPRPHSTGAYVRGSDVVPPRHNPRTTEWAVIGEAGYNDSRPNLSYPFPVCFCTGEWFAGDRNARGVEGVWHWFILLPTPTPTLAPVAGDACEENDWVSDAEYFADYNRDCNPDSL